MLIKDSLTFDRFIGRPYQVRPPAAARLKHFGTPSISYSIVFYNLRQFAKLSSNFEQHIIKIGYYALHLLNNCYFVSFNCFIPFLNGSSSFFFKRHMLQVIWVSLQLHVQCKKLGKFVASQAQKKCEVRMCIGNM